jgi:uncharacterized protein YjbI with pentapeptide repeats
MKKYAAYLLLTTACATMLGMSNNQRENQIIFFNEKLSGIPKDLNLENAIFNDVIGVRIWLTSRNMQKAQFENAYLSDSCFNDSNFTDALFSNSHLQNADLSDTDLTNAIFRNTDLSNTNFENADLTGALFEHCTISRTTNFKNAFMSRTEFFNLPRHIVRSILNERRNKPAKK